MVPTLSFDTHLIQSNEQKTFALKKFIQENPFYELQDLYRWLYYGEFGPQEHSYLQRDKRKPELIKIKEDIESELKMKIEVTIGDTSHITQRIQELIETKKLILPEKIFEPMGLSQRFIMVFVTRFYEQKCPLKRLVNLYERAPALRGTRMQFKLDWAFSKEFIIRNSGRFTRQDFYGFEDRINFHQIPDVPFTNTFLEKRPAKYRIVPRKLFFDFFPEFDTKEDILFTKPKDSLID